MNKSKYIKDKEIMSYDYESLKKKIKTEFKSTEYFWYKYYNSVYPYLVQLHQLFIKSIIGKYNRFYICIYQDEDPNMIYIEKYKSYKDMMDGYECGYKEINISLISSVTLTDIIMDFISN